MTKCHTPSVASHNCLNEHTANIKAIRRRDTRGVLVNRFLEPRLDFDMIKLMVAAQPVPKW
jgi:hypothetical protein